MSEWKEIEFSKILIDESISYGIVQPGAHTEINSIPIIRVNNIKNGYIQTEDVLKVEAAIEDKYKRTRLNGGELLITVVGSIGECAIVPENLKGWNVARAVSVAKIKREYDIRFIKYAFQTDDLIFQMYGNTNDTVQPTLNLSSLKALKFSIPPLTEQQSIASILSSLDDKIDLLHRQNATLEKMAETLFRQWFVERFPEPVEGEAKEEWEEKPLSFFGAIICGKTPPKSKHEYFNGKIPFIKIPDMHGKIFVFDSEDSLTKCGRDFQANKTLPPFSISVSCIATVGLVTMNAFESQTNQQINSIIPKKDYYRYFLYLQMNSMYDELHAMASGGTATLNLNTSNFAKITVPYVDDNYLINFNEATKPLFDKVYNNQTQIRTLTALRDTLLPKLMSGEVRVEN